MLSDIRANVRERPEIAFFGDTLALECLASFLALLFSKLRANENVSLSS